jgi:aerobic-type carbon monoxide dehydrogenase small subunit (CoxS/CutS family)
MLAEPVVIAAAVPARYPLRMTVNGDAVVLHVEPRELLLPVLRDRLGLRGVKQSCDVQVCGVCTVLVDGVPVSSCTTLAVEAEGKAVETIEGLSTDGRLHPIQQAFVDRAAVQCGFCTPGMILSAKALLAENPRPSRDEIVAYLGGNICRCTGYFNVVAAVEDAAERLAAERIADGRLAAERLTGERPVDGPPGYEPPSAAAAVAERQPVAPGEGGR